MTFLAVFLEHGLKSEAIDGAFDRRHATRGEFALAFFGRIKKVQELAFSLSAGRKSFALKQIEEVLVTLPGITD